MAMTFRQICGAACAAVVFALALPAPQVAAQGFGDFTVTPTRLLFEGRTTAETVTLVNRSAETATFRISFVHMRMTEQGELVQLEQLPPDYRAAEPMLRYAPRQIEIPPGGSQVVRLALRKPDGLASGEYRSHMFFRAVPPESRGQAVGQAPDQPGGVRIELIPIFGVTIPVIVRHGPDLDAGAALADLALDRKDGAPVLRLNIRRTGNVSAFGDLAVSYVPPGGGAPVLVAELNRVAVYPEIEARRVEIQLHPPAGTTLAPGGTIDVTYRGADPAATVLARGTLRVP